MSSFRSLVHVLFFVLLAIGLTQSQQDLCPAYPQLVPIAGSELSAAFEQVDAFINEALKTVSVPGFFISVVYNDTIIWSKGYGTKNFTDPNAGPPELDSIVRVASITKTFTTLMMFMLRDQGIVGLDDAVSRYLTDFSVQNPFPTRRPITLHQLASHTSGLQRETPDCDNCTEAEILALVAQTYLLTPPYAAAHYSNLGIALLGRALEKSVFTSYENWTSAQILSPLGMSNSGFYFSPEILQNMAVGAVVLANGSWVSAKVDPPGWDCPCGGLFSTPRDISTYISAIFRNDLPAGANPSQIVDGVTINEWQKAFFVLTDGVNAFGTPWELLYTQKYWLRSKAGALSGYRSQVATIPELKLGVFTTALSEDIDNTPADTNQSVLTVPIMNILAPALEALLWSRQPSPPKPSGIGLIGGKYIGDEVLTIDLQDDNIYAVLGDGSVFLLTEYLTLQSQLLYRVHWANSSAIDCRWLNDGPDNEIMYFNLSNGGSGHAESLIFMGTTIPLHVDELKK